MTLITRALVAVAALLSALAVAPAAAQTCNLSPAGSTNQRLAVVNACLAQVLAKNAAQDAAIAPLASQAAQITALQGSLTTLTARVNGFGDQASALATLNTSVSTLTARVNVLAPDVAALKTWKLNVDASLADLRADIDALAGSGSGSGGPQAALEPNTDDGRPVTQLGVWYATYWSPVRPFLDEMRLNTPRPDPLLFYRQDGSGATLAEAIAADAIDPVTLNPRPGSVGASPAPFSRVNLGTVAYMGRFFPAAYTGRWVLTWDGVGTPDIAGMAAPVVTAANRREYELTFTGVNEGLTVPRVEFTNIGAGFSNVRFYRKADEAKVLAGDVYTDDFLAMVRRYKIVRTMDWTAQGTPWFKASQQRGVTSGRWADAGGTTDNALADPTNARTYAQFGVPLRYQFDLAVDTSTALWLNVSPFLGAANSTFVYFHPDTPYQDRFDVGGPAIAAQAAQQIASAEWDTYADLIVAAAIDAQYPVRRILYIELGNEWWNTANPFFNNTYWLDRIADGLFGAQPNNPRRRRAGGWMSARLAEAIQGALTRAGRGDQEWVLVIAGQNANPQTTTQALEGFRDYFVAKNVDPALWFPKVGVSVSSYFEGAFEPGGAFASLDTANETTRRNAILAEVEANPLAAANKVVDWFINSTAAGHLTLPNVFTLQQQHKVIAQSFGARLIIPYEGGDHEWAMKFWGSPWTDSAGYRDMLDHLRFGEPGRRLTAGWIAQQQAALPEIGVTNYAGAGWYPALRAYRFDSWHDAAYGQTTGRETALNTILRPAQ